MAPYCGVEHHPSRHTLLPRAAGFARQEGIRHSMVVFKFGYRPAHSNSWVMLLTISGTPFPYFPVDKISTLFRSQDALEAGSLLASVLLIQYNLLD